MSQSTHATPRHRPALVLRGCLLLLAALFIRQGPSAQTFTSGSDGSDGALTIAANAGTIVFDPFDTARWGKVLDDDGDGVYNFTTISIGSGSTLVLRGDKVNRAPYWLASGAVVISSGGTIDLSGAAGAGNAANELEVRRVVAIPGSGGYAGGSGGRQTPSLAATAGEGPGGGTGGIPNNNNVNCGIPFCGRGGTYGGNRFLMPLIGGSGGEGGTWTTAFGPNGGAGGGAIVIASSTVITLDGQIRATGGTGGFNGNGVWGGGGSGGGIRLVAPTILGSGTLFVAGGSAPLGSGGSGWVRLEANQLSTSLVFSPSAGTTTRGAPGVPATLKPANLLRVAAIDGITIPPNPSGMFSLPDVIINRTGPVDVAIEAKGILPGTVVTLQIYPETPVDIATVNLTAQGTLAGTLQSSTVTVPITFPFGFSRGWVRASWTQ